ncbi:MAG: hypothetical protein KC443_20565 [Anaerolineales bacterium]|nr:hypothetical protein [Anaerolineales bacterium]
MDYTLTILDTASIQSYIFGSNELRENIGASHLVYQATTLWVQDVLEEIVPGCHNYRVQLNEKRPYNPDFRIEARTVFPCAEVLYAGGGNTFVLFRGENSLETAQDFVYRLSSRIIEHAPGLNLYAAHESVIWNDNLPLKVNNVLQQLAVLKTQLPVYAPALGLSVTADCTSTGLPANYTHPDPDKQGTLANRANRQVWTQWLTANSATTRLRDLFKFVNPKYEWTDNLDKIGKLPDRDESFIAVVHADGNGMGRQMLRLSKYFETQPDKSRAYISAVRALSLSYQDTAQAALTCTVRDLYDSLNYHEKDGNGDQKRYYSRAKNDSGVMTSYFPFRPVVFGGDDITWVCAGPWGIPMAHRYLTYLEQMQLPRGSDLLADWQADTNTKKAIADDIDSELELPTKPYACAGVSIVKTHYPISRAYENSEALLGSAKSQVYLYDQKKRSSAIDWHITTTGLAGELSEIRQREYETTEEDKVTSATLNVTAMHKLTMRPLLLDNTYTWRNWQNFHNIYEQFAHGWFTARNKMMALREAIRGGTMAVAEFQRIERKGTRLPELPALPHVKIGTVNVELELKDGWVSWPPKRRQQLANITDQRQKKQALDPICCAYFDAIEIEDQFLKLVQHAETCEERL